MATQLNNWLSIDKTSGTGNAEITLTASSYKELVDRTTSLKIQGISTNAILNVRQNAFVPTVSSGIGTGLSILFAWIYLYVFLEGKPLYFFFAFLLVADLVGQFYYALMYIIPLEYVGKIAMVVNIINYAAPGQNIIKVIKEGNYKLIPIVTTVFGAMCSVSWFTFGVLQKDWNCIIPNPLGMLF